MIKLIDILNENYPPYKADMVSKVRYKASDVWTNDQKLAIKKGYLEGNTKKPDPKKGTGKKPEGSDRRLYTDENPKDTVRIKFKTAQDIKDTLAKKSFKAKPHARKSQVINLIHQRVRAAYGKAKDPEVKARLKRALDYIEKRKEASKEKTQRLNKIKETDNPQSGKAAPFGSGYAPIKKEGTCGYNKDAETNKMLDTPGGLNEKCWKGYTQKGMKTMFGKKYPNCVKK